MPTYRVVSNQQLTPSTILLSLRLEKGRALQFQPGQYAAIRAQNAFRLTPTRCFSIVNSPSDHDVLQFSMRVKGRFSRYIKRLQPDELIKVQGPYGGFVIENQTNKNVVLLAGGIGITPFMSMIRSCTVTQANQKLKLFYAAKDIQDIPFASELLWHAEENTHFSPTFVIGKGPIAGLPPQAVISGRLTLAELEQRGISLSDTQTVFYVCGPPSFMRSLVKSLSSRGVDKSRIFTEAFSQGPNHQTGKILDWSFGMYALTALGLSAGSIAVMVGDLLRMIPPKSSYQASSRLVSTTTSQRQIDINSLINSLPTQTSGTSASPAVAAAEAAAQPNQSTSVATTQTTTPSTTVKTPVTTPTVTPTPVVTPAPVCTTTQSGVTKC